MSDVSETDLGLGDLSDDSDGMLPDSDTEQQDPDQVGEDTLDEGKIDDSTGAENGIPTLYLRANNAYTKVPNLKPIFQEGAEQVGVLRCHNSAILVKEEDITALHKPGDPKHAATWKKIQPTIEAVNVIVVMAKMKTDDKHPEINGTTAYPHWYLSFRVAGVDSDDRLILCHIPKPTYQYLCKTKLLKGSTLNDLKSPNANQRPVSVPINLAKTLNVNDGSGLVRTDIKLNTLVANKPKADKKEKEKEPASPAATSARSSPPGTPVKKRAVAEPTKPTKTARSMFLSAHDKALHKEAAKKPAKPVEQVEAVVANGAPSDAEVEAPKTRKRQNVELNQEHIIPKRRLIVDLAETPVGGKVSICIRYTSPE